MKKLLAAALIVALTGCTTETKFGKCIGAFDTPDPKLEYNVSGWNIAMAVLFVETIVVPAVVVAAEIRCPEGPAFQK